MPYVTLDQVKPPAGFGPAPAPSPKNAGGVTLDQVKPPPGWSASTSAPAADSGSQWMDNKTKLPSMSQTAVNQIPGGYQPGQAPHTSAGAGWHQNVVQQGLDNTVGRVVAPIDAGIGMAQGAAMNVLGNLYGIGKEVATGNFGHGLAERTSAAYQQAHAYHPQSPQGQQLLGAAGNALNKSGLVGLGPMGIGDDAASLRASFERNAPARAQAGAMAGDATSLAARPIAAVGRPVVGAAKSATRFLTDPEASRGAQGLRGMARGLESEVPAASAKPTQPGQLPDLTPPLAGSKMGVNAQLRNLFETRANALGQAQKEAGSAIHDAISSVPQSKLEPGAPLHTQIGSLRNDLIQMQDDAGSKPTFNALQDVIDSLGRIRDNSKAPLSSLIELRRQLSEKAAFGQPKQGFDAIGEHNAGILAQRLNDLIDRHIEGYPEARAAYKAVKDQQEPLGARFLKEVGADEAGATDIGRYVLASPENLAKAKAALGGDATALDTLLAKRVQADLAGKSARDIAQYIKEREPVLKGLPQAQRAALDAQSTQEAREALKSVMDKARTQYAQNMQDYTRTAKLQRQYATDFEKLRNLPTNKLPDATRSILGSMRNDDLISPQRYSEALKRVNEAEKSIKRHALLRGAVKTVGAVGFIRYALHRKMWNIIVGATD